MDEQVPPVTYPIRPQPARTRWGVYILWAMVILLALALCISLVANFMLGTVLVSAGIEKPVAVNERFVQGSGRDKIAVIPVAGIIRSESTESFFSSDTGLAEQVLVQLKEAKDASRVRAVILEIDSPGGELTASDIICNGVLDFKDSGKKLIVCMKGLGASGAYYISAPADWIVAHPTTLTGSIGVVVHSLNIEGLYEKIGLKDVTLKSGDKKDILSPVRAMTPEEEKIIQDTIDEMQQRFMDIVLGGRELTPEAIKTISDGRIFTARQAQELGLIDEIGYFEDAISAAMRLAGLTEASVVRYERVFSLSDIFRSSLQSLMFRRAPLSMKDLLELETPRLMYLWAPGSQPSN